MTTLRDALTDALGQAEEAPQVDQPQVQETEVHEGETAEQAAQRARDEKGRFAKNEQPKPEESKPQVTPDQPTTRKPPSSWKKDYWGQWEKLGTDPELARLQDYIEQREQDFAKGVSTYKQQWEQAQPLYEAVQPFAQQFQQYGIQPQQLVSGMLNAHQVLSSGSPEQKLQAFAKLASDYGVPLQALMQGRADPQQMQVMQTVADLNRWRESFEQQRQAEQQASLRSQIESFQKDKPHFNAVRETMAGLLQSGVAGDLDTAYEKAIRLHDDIWQQEQARQAQEAAKSRQQQIAGKKAAAVSPKSSSPTGAMTQGNAKKGLRDTLAEAVDAASSGRF